jgi:predicted dehydrogenase
MSNDVTTVGIVGLGNIGYAYDSEAPAAFARTHARAAALHPEAKLMWGVDPSGDARAGFEKEYGVETFDQLRVALESNPVDVAVLAVPIEHRAELWPMLLEAQPKLVISEKPLAVTAEESASISDSCVSAGVALMVNYPRRYSNVTERAKQLIEEGELGSFQSGHVWYGKGVLNNGSHLVNLLVQLLGDDWDVEDIRVHRSGYPDGDVDAAFRMTRNTDSIEFAPIDPDIFSLTEVDLIFEKGRLRFVNHAFDLIEQVGLAPSSFPGYLELADENLRTDNTADHYQMSVISYAVAHLDDPTTHARDIEDVIAAAAIIDQVIEASR